MADVDGGDLRELEEFVGGMLKSLDPAARRGLLRRVARQMRTSNQKRIAAQRNPDESAFAERRTQNTGEAPKKRNSGKRKKRTSIREGVMFRKIRQSKYLKVGSTPYEAWIGFAGRVSRIARIHQLGLRDRPARHAREVRYDKRELLGMTAADREELLDAVIGHLLPD